MSTSDAEQPVLIAGVGPPGLTAAIALRARGVPAATFERDPDDRDRSGSRAIYVHSTALQTLERNFSGLGQALDELGVDIHWDTGVEAVGSTADGVHVTTDDGREWETPYLTGTGGGSQVRKEIGGDFDGTRSENSFIIADVATLGDGTIEEEPIPFERLFHYDGPAADGRNVMLVPFTGGGGPTFSVSATTTPRRSPATGGCGSSSATSRARSTSTTSSGPRRRGSSK